MRVQSTKHDGSLHYDMAVHHLGDGEGPLGPERRVFQAPGSPVRSYRGDWPAKRPALLVYWTGRPYNLCLSWNVREGTDWREGKWDLHQYYLNVANTASWDGERVQFVDYDLDVVWRPHRRERSLWVDDEDEFAEHQIRFGYSAELVRACRDSVDEMMGLIEARTFPFDGSLERWRPAMPAVP